MIKDPRQDTPSSPYDTPYAAEEGEKPNTIKTQTVRLTDRAEGDYPVGDGDGHLESSDQLKVKLINLSQLLRMFTKK